MTKQFSGRHKHLMSLWERVRAPFGTHEVLEVEDRLEGAAEQRPSGGNVVDLTARTTKKVVFTEHRGEVAPCDDSGRVLTRTHHLQWVEAEGFIIIALVDTDAYAEDMGSRLLRIQATMISLEMWGLPVPINGLVTAPPEIAAKFLAPEGDPPTPSKKWEILRVEGKPVIFETEQDALDFIKRNQIGGAQACIQSYPDKWIIKMLR